MDCIIIKANATQSGIVFEASDNTVETLPTGFPCKFAALFVFHKGEWRDVKIGFKDSHEILGAFISAMAKFFDKLDTTDPLAKTIDYNLNPADNVIVVSIVGNFNYGSVAGNLQFGSSWWFLDQKVGMEKQMNVLSNMGLLSHFLGMLTNLRSFFSYLRHDYFRRILCNLIGSHVEKGLLPASEMTWTGEMVENISYKNANSYFGF
ncbi:glucuronate isomerase [Fulvivirga lutimaris]|uniref:glucuronate isomerase n=1 Tax=Fulvivirga lutimaris TaxID=1819566 RepID=UPI0012BC46EA|nr:hypothetical protein [Fulvivirga lutimaris]